MRSYSRRARLGSITGAGQNMELDEERPEDQGK
jgi:hypothetical protein